MTYAIGDIHGCRVALQSLLALIRPTSADLVVCLGDYIDRGPDARGVVQTLMQLRQDVPLIHLRGNHEVHLARALESTERKEFFLGTRVGGTATVDSYGGSLSDIPTSHLQFLTQESQLYYETDSHLYVHGGVDPHLPLAEHDLHTLTTTRFIDPRPHDSGKTMLCGHTIQGDLPTMVGKHSICLDTGAYDGGWLTALEVETGTVYQANEKGETRHGIKKLR